MNANPAGPKPKLSLQGNFALGRRLLRDYLGRQRLNLTFAMICMAGGAATYALLAWLIDPTVRFLFLEKRADMVLIIPAAIVVTVLLRGGFNFGETALTNLIGQKLIADAQGDMVRSLIRL
ncbi:MAG: hypothetical protein KGO48_19395, partial [Alphaproteobacteria bacterium]|nr:hypothetical protein [Alphaproteobacteria bacterium]